MINALSPMKDALPVIHLLPVRYVKLNIFSMLLGSVNSAHKSSLTVKNAPQAQLALSAQTVISSFSTLQAFASPALRRYSDVYSVGIT